MNKILTVIFLSLFGVITSSQTKVKILDEETKAPITNAKLLSNNQIYYSNEDGVFVLPEINSLSESTIEVPFYETIHIEDLSKIKNAILLKPSYKQIEEVTITKLDFNAFIKNLYENYNKFYNTFPHLYEADYKEKLIINGKINSLLVSDINLYAAMNAVGMTITGNVDKYIQIGLDKVKYYKIDNSEINFKEFTNKRALSWFNGRMFLNGEFAILQFGLDKIPVKTQLIYQDETLKKFSFYSEAIAKKGATFKGNFVVDKESGAISHMEVEQTYDKSERTYKSSNGKMMIDTKSVVTTYDYYKKDKKFFPAKFTLTQKGTLTKDGKDQDFRRIREVIFTTGKEVASDYTLQNRMDISNKDLLFYIPNKVTKDSQNLLSTEEQLFINEQ
ncbi:hypothetical protein [Bergeyella sp. RCAD1439]|uniref:hypothetical protein n=1 Tax=Bergeyella anatis TaxID=3113737 RepID=UPI002E17C411|nr:hypothetical protein [Bergeyella sp. RCAD1439]